MASFLFKWDRAWNIATRRDYFNYERNSRGHILTAYASFIVELTDKATEDKNIIRIYLKCYIKRCIICVRVLIQKYYH